MESFSLTWIAFGTLIFAVNGQQTLTCPTSLPSECYFTGAATRSANAANPNQYFIIGGLFDIHNKGGTAYNCDATLSDSNFINLLAFFWGIDKYYNQFIGRRGATVSVGAVAFDNCMRTDQTIENLYGYAQCKVNIQGLWNGNLVAYVGPYTNDDAKRTGALASDLGITIFTPTADAMDLTFNDQKFLMKMSPSFLYDLKAVVAFLNQVNSSYVLILYSGNDSFWKAAYDELTKQIRSSSYRTPVCIQYTADVSDTQTMNDTIAALKTRQKAKYIVPLMSKETLGTIIDRLSSAVDRDPLNFIFILTSRIGKDLNFLVQRAAAANNTIIIDTEVPISDDDDKDMKNFSIFLNNLNQNNTSLNLPNVNIPWLQTYLQNNIIQNLSSADTPSPLESSVRKTLLSVKAIIQGMDTAMVDCNGAKTVNNYQFCDDYRILISKNDKLYMQLKNASTLHTKGSSSSNTGDVLLSNIKYKYYIYMVRNTPGFSEIGSLTVNSAGQVEATFGVNLQGPGYGYKFDEPVCPTPNQNMCCEVATTLPPITSTVSGLSGATGSSLATDSTTSGYIEVTYPTGQAITGAYSNAARSDSEYGTRFDRGHKWIIALGVLAGLGILCVFVFEIYILYKLLGTRLGNKWRTMWLGQLLLFGIFLCYLVLFAYLPVPTKATCGITRFGVGVSYAFCFAVLLVKLMVILTSKPADVLLPGDVETPNYLKGTYQFLMFIFAIGVQIVIDIQWLITVPPEAVQVTSNNGEKVWVCNHYTWEAGKAMDVMSSFVRTEFENHLMSLIYIMIMILITTILALNAHGIITNHRESIFVGIASGFSIPIWLAWGLVGGLNKSHDYAQEFGDACIAFGLFLTATLILFAMFLPKVRHLVNMGIEGIYLEDDQETVYGGSVIMAPPSKGPGSVIFVNNQGIYSEPVVIDNGLTSTYLKHPGSVYSTPGVYNTSGAYIKHPESLYGGSTRVLRVTDDLRGRPPQKRSQSEVAYGGSRRPQSNKGTLPRSRSHTNLGAL